MITKFLALIVITFFLLVPPVFAESYPFRMPENTAIRTVLEQIRTTGDKVAGVVADHYDNHLIWIEKKDGTCVAFLLQLRQNKSFELECDAALELFDTSVQMGQATDPRNKL